MNKQCLLIDTLLKEVVQGGKCAPRCGADNKLCKLFWIFAQRRLNSGDALYRNKPRNKPRLPTAGEAVS
ncbi:MAG: hypothetical protein EAZ99_14660 [Alphaproteobacteria bacterium]|nr:MAG: hypothetical protein EAZ99_14660 [Alphaproteobacteria bacterium]